jgi:hypothetical protein
LGTTRHFIQTKAWHDKLQMKLTHLLRPAAAGRGYMVTELPRCLANGCQEWWVVDHKTKTITFTSKNGQSVKYSAGANLSLEVLGGSRVSLYLIFT